MFDLSCRLSYGQNVGECGGFYQVCCALPNSVGSSRQKRVLVGGDCWALCQGPRQRFQCRLQGLPGRVQAVSEQRAPPQTEVLRGEGRGPSTVPVHTTGGQVRPGPAQAEQACLHDAPHLPYLPARPQNPHSGWSQKFRLWLGSYGHGQLQQTQGFAGRGREHHQQHRLRGVAQVCWYPCKHLQGNDVCWT